MVVLSLSIMWPTAVLTYKFVRKLRLFMLNKIISFEPCGGEKTSLYGLSRLPRSKMASRNDNNSAKGSDCTGAEYVIMLDSTRDKGDRKGIWSEDDISAVSSLSSAHQIV